jgi:DNA-binding response OmpR family regulator
MVHLLLVEDDLGFQETLGDALSDSGFDVVVVSNGTQALAELDVHATQFEQVITDIELGAGPDGWDIGRRAREFVADMPVVYISGNCASEWPSKGVANSVFIAKPFTMARMIMTLTTLLVTTGGCSKKSASVIKPGAYHSVQPAIGLACGCPSERQISSLGACGTDSLDSARAGSTQHS